MNKPNSSCIEQIQEKEQIKRAVIVLSGTGSNMEAIVHANLPKLKIAAVISNRPDAAGLEKARNLNIPTQVLDHTCFESREAFDKVLQVAISQHRPDWVILAGFMRVLTSDFVRFFAGKLVNIHPSLLPKYKGTQTHQRVLENNEREHGASVHLVTEELDGGPILTQCKIPVLKADTISSLASRLQKAEHFLYPETLRLLSEETLAFRKGQLHYRGVAQDACLTLTPAASAQPETAG